MAGSGTSTPSASRSRATICTARSECPPSAKKSSRTPTRSTPSTFAQMPQRISSTGVRGAA
jgi:hypothetical protein